MAAINKICYEEQTKRDDFNRKYSDYILIDSQRASLKLPIPHFTESLGDIENQHLEKVRGFVFDGEDIIKQFNKINQQSEDLVRELDVKKQQIHQAQQKLFDFIQRIHLQDGVDVSHLTSITDID